MNKIYTTGKQAVKIPLSLTKPHPADPFKPYTSEKLYELANSIAEYGLFEPILVKEENDGSFAILAGKNRANACRLINHTEIDAYICGVDDDTAIMIITDSNLKHRDRLLPSERGFAYRMQLEALKRQGKRSDLEEETTSVKIAPKLRSNEIVAAHNAVSVDDIKRYIRLTYLIPELLERIDNDRLPIGVGIDFSHLDETSQRMVYEKLIAGFKPIMDLQKSAYIKHLFKKKGTFTEDSLNKLLHQSRGVIERVIPMINRKMLKSLITEIPLPENDEVLIRMFAVFLRDTFKAHGSLNVLHERREIFR